jgi:hypothetical protein
MASFKTYKAKLDRKIEKAIEEPVFVPRKIGEERINTSLRSMTTPEQEVRLDVFNKQKMIAKDFLYLSGSYMDMMMLLSSWVSHQKINSAEYNLIVKYVNKE